MWTFKNELNRHIKDACRKMRKHNGKTSQIGVMLKTSEFIVYSDKKVLQVQRILNWKFQK